MADAIAFGLLVAVLAVAAVTDLKTGKVYNWLTYPALVGGLVYWAGWNWASPEVGKSIQDALVGLAAGLVPFAIIFSLGGLGGGDVKIMAAVGSISADWQVVLGTALYGLILGFIMAVAIMVRRRIVMRTLRRIGSAALLAASKVKPDIPDDSPRIPMSVAFTIGGILAGIEHLLHAPLPWSRFV